MSAARSRKHLMGQEQIFVAIVLSGLAVAIAWVDIRTYRIPNALSGLVALAGFVTAWRFSSAPFTDHLIGAAAGYAVFAIVGEIHFRLRGQEGLGLGDAKLFGATGAWLGWAALPVVALEASLIGIVLILLMRKKTKSDNAAPFGPALAFALWATWIFGAPFVEMTWR